MKGRVSNAECDLQIPTGRSSRFGHGDTLESGLYGSSRFSRGREYRGAKAEGKPREVRTVYPLAEAGGPGSGRLTVSGRSHTILCPDPGEVLHEQDVRRVRKVDGLRPRCLARPQREFAYLPAEPTEGPRSAAAWRNESCPRLHALPAKRSGPQGRQLITATASISTRAPRGSRLTWTQARDGASWSKVSAHTRLTRSKSSMSVR